MEPTEVIEKARQYIAALDSHNQSWDMLGTREAANRSARKVQDALCDLRAAVREWDAHEAVRGETREVQE